MEVTSGSLNYTATIDYSQLDAAVKNIEKRLAGIENVAESTGESIDNIGSGLNKVLAVVGGVTVLKSFVTQMFNVRKSFQDTQSVMEVFLGSSEKAEAHLKELQKYAWYNMFDFETLTQASAQLQAFGTDVDDVIPLIDRLSNIAAGTKTDLLDLVASFNRAKSLGYADSRMLQSFATKGLDVVKTLRDMGIAVDNTGVTFEQLMTSVESATNEGGRFYNLMDAQFENLSSLAGAVEDDISIMFNEIGEKLQPTMESILKAVHTLIDNYETIGRVLAALLTTYGAYRTALITTTIVQNLQAAGIAKLTALEKLHYAWLVLQEKAQALLNKTMLSNPYVLLATVIVGSIAGLVAYSKATNDTRNAEEKLNDTLEDRLKVHNQLKEDANSYIDTIINERENVEALNEAYKNLIELEPFRNMSLEELKGKSVDELKATLEAWDNAITEQAINASLNEALQKWYGSFSALKAPLAEVGSLNKKAAYNNAQDALPEIYAANKKHTEQQITELQKLDAAQRKIKYDEMIQNLQDMNTALQESEETAQYYGMTMSKNAPLIAMNNQAIDLLTQNLEALNQSEIANTIPIFDPNDERSVISQIKAAEEELRNLRAEMLLTGNYTPEMITKIQAAEKQLSSGKDLYKTLTGREYGKSDDIAVKHLRSAEDAEIDLIKDSYQKKRKAAQNEAQRKIEDLQRTLKEETNLTAEARSAINREISAVRQKLLQDLEDIDNAHIVQVIKNKKALEDLDREQIKTETDWKNEREEARIALMQGGFAKEMAEMQLEHLKRIDEIQNQAKKEAEAYEEAAKKRYLFENTDDNEDDFYMQWKGIPEYEQDKINQRTSERMAIEQSLYSKHSTELYRQLLAEYGNFTVQKEDIDKKYFADYSAATLKYLSASTEQERGKFLELMDNIKREWSKSTFSITLDTINSTAYASVEERMKAINDAYETYIYDLSVAGATEAEIAKVKKEQVETAGKIVTINAQIASLEDKKLIAVDSNDVNEIKRLNAEIAKLKKQLEEIGVKSSNISFLDSIKQNIQDVDLNDITDFLNDISGVLTEIGKSTGNDAIKEAGEAIYGIGNAVSNIAQGAATGGWIGAVIAAVGTIAKEVGSVISENEKLKKSIKKARLDKWVDDMQDEMNTSFMFGDDEINKVNKSIDVIRKATEQLKGLYDTMNSQEIPNFWSKDNSMFAAATEAFEKGYNDIESYVIKTQDRSGFLNFLGIKDKFSNIKDVINDLGYEMYDQYGNLNAEALQAILDTYEDLGQADREWMEEAITYSEQYKEAMDNVASYLKSLFSNVVDTIVDSVFEGAVDMEAIVADVGKKMAKDLMKSMIMSTYFDTMQDKMIEVIRTSGGMTEQASAQIFGMFSQAMQNLEGDLPQWMALADNFSKMFNFDNDVTSITSGSTLDSASQESIDLLNGQLNAMRTVQGRIDGTIQNILIEMRGFRSDVNTQMIKSNNKLDMIVDNTSEGGSLLRQLGIWMS